MAGTSALLRCVRPGATTPDEAMCIMRGTIRTYSGIVVSLQEPLMELLASTMLDGDADPMHDMMDVTVEAQSNMLLG